MEQETPIYHDQQGIWYLVGHSPARPFTSDLFGLFFFPLFHPDFSFVTEQLSSLTPLTFPSCRWTFSPCILFEQAHLHEFTTATSSFATLSSAPGLQARSIPRLTRSPISS